MQEVNGMTPSYVVSHPPLEPGWKAWLTSPALGFIQYSMIISRVF